MQEELVNNIVPMLELILDGTSKPFYSDFEFWTLFVLTVTLFSLIIYTHYTKKIHESAFMPFIHIVGHDFAFALQEENNRFKARINLVNLGKGPAIDVKVHGLKIGYFDLRSNKKLELLQKKEDFSKFNDGKQSTKIYMNIRKLEAATSMPSNILKISCKDQVGKKYTFNYDISNLNSIRYLGV